MSTTIGAIAAARRPKWQYPPAQPTPRILHFPRRPRRKSSKSLSGKPTSMEGRKERKVKLETLFDQERVFTKTNAPIVLLDAGGESERRREKVDERENDNVGDVVVRMEEEKWRFQAEMLRAECNLLRMEKEIAVKKLERNRVKIEKMLRNAVQTLVSGRQRMRKENNMEIEIEEEIQQLAEKLEKLRSNLGVKDLEVRKHKNLDKQAVVLQRRLEMFRPTSDEICVQEIQDMAEISLSIKSKSTVRESLFPSDSSNVEILRRKMEGLSNGLLLERMKEEYGSMLSSASSSTSSSASTSMRIELTDLSSLSVQRAHKETMSHEENVCSGRCKAIVRRIVEQVRTETEQWSQMQDMLGKVREEIEELHASRDFWEDRALDYDKQIQSLHSSVQEWRQKAISSESKAKMLETQVCKLHKEIERYRKEGKKEEVMRGRASSLTLQHARNEMEKHVMVCHLKENHHTNENTNKQEDSSNNQSRKTKGWTSNLVGPKRSPFQDIGNSSVSLRQHGNAINPLHCSLPYKTNKKI